jgi:choloylglycine hydrolase
LKNISKGENKMKKKNIVILIVCLIFFYLSSNVYPCTTFCIKDNKNIIFGRNLDFSTGFGYVIINKRNVTKTALVFPPENPITWTSKYGSITFNQMGRELPYGGLNEAGLVIDQMWLDTTKYPEPDNRYGLTELQWVQYQLDNSITINDVIASDTSVRVSFESQPIHFLLCDKQGDVATIEYINGKLVYHKDKDLPVTVLANSTYEESIDYTKKFIEFGGNDTIPKTMKSLDRFALAASMVKKFDEKKSENIINYSFDILKTVSQGEATHWSIVYDIANMKIHYKTYGNRETRVISLEDFNFSCELPVLITDIENNIDSIEKDFIDYSTELNKELIENTFSHVEFLKNIPPEVRDGIARYPESLICNQ